MSYSRLTASFFSLFVAGTACGPGESLPPNIDAGINHDAGETCPGVCVPLPEADWNAPALVWVGAEADAPPCSAVAGAPGEYYTGYGDPDGPPCGACKCEKPSGSCKLPATMTAAAASCAEDGSAVTHTSFDPPQSWDGTCTSSNAIPGVKLCGGAPCVQSVTIAPLMLTQGGCLPVEPPNNQPPPAWKTFVRACVRDSFPPSCSVEIGVCAPRPPSQAFRICTLRRGDADKLDCPSTYPDRSVFYDGPVPDCSPCACGVPSPSSCNGSISFFQDGACGTPPLQTINVNAKGPKCTDVLPGSALASKVASELSYSGGYCTPSGGVPLATVICCIP
jgi:hypothetical protein